MGKLLTSKSVGTGPSSYEKRIYRAAVSQRLRETLPYWKEMQINAQIITFTTVAYPGILFGGGVQQIQLRTEDRQRGSGGGSPLVRVSGCSCDLVQEISFHIVKFFLNFWYFKTIYDGNEFICHC